MRRATVEIYPEQGGERLAHILVSKPLYGQPMPLPQNHIQRLVLTREGWRVEAAVYNRKMSLEDVQRFVRLAIDGSEVAR